MSIQTLLPVKKVLGRLSIAALALAILSPASAWADSTVVLTPTGSAKKRNVEKVTKSIAESVGAVDGLALSDGEVGVDCVVEASCLASARPDDGVSKVVGVHLSRSGPTFVLLFIAVDALSGTELARQEITGIKRKGLATSSGQALVDFVKSIPEPVAVEAPVEEAPVEEVPIEEAVVEEPVVEEPMVEDSMAEEGTEGERTLSVAPMGVGDEGDISVPYKVELGLATGVSLPQISSELGTAASLEIDVGVPVWKSLTIVGAIAYSQPTVDSGLSDPRLTGMAYSTETTQRELTVTAGATWRFLKFTSSFNAYAGLGPRIWLLETITNGTSGGASFGENQETSTRIGGAAWAGAEYLIGPGAATAELDLGGSDLPHLVTGDVATTAIALQIGYRLRL
jgi:hypothetical protein